MDKNTSKKEFILKKKNEEAKSYNKSSIIIYKHKRLPTIKRDGDKKKYLMVEIDHYSAEWYVMITENKSQILSAKHGFNLYMNFI